MWTINKDAVDLDLLHSCVWQFKRVMMLKDAVYTRSMRLRVL